MASTTSILFSLQSFTPFSTDSIRGFGSTPPHSTNSKPLSFNILITSSYRPIFLIEPPPYTIKTFLPNCSKDSFK